MTNFFRSEKNKDVIIGNCTIIYPNVFYKLSYEEIMIWRTFTYDNLSSQKTFKVRDLINYSNKKNFQINSKLNLLIEKNLNISELDIVAYDSSFICSNDIDITKHIESLNENSILVDTYITMIECFYKKHNKNKFISVNMSNVNNYVDIINGKKIKNKKIKHVHKTTFHEANKFLYFCENSFYKKLNNFYNKETNKFKKGIRNEINDDAILFILNNLKMSFGFKKIILYTLDKKMIDKCLDIGIESRSL